MSNPAPSTAPEQWDLLFTQPFTSRGEWSPATNYTLNDITQYAGNSWIALAPSSNQLPDMGDYWELFVSKGNPGAIEAGEAGAVPTISIGVVESVLTAYVEAVEVSGGVILDFGLPRGDKGDTGFSPSRTTISFSTGILNAGESTTINAEIATSAQILNLASSHAARVRIYQDSASAIADVSRVPGVLPASDIIIFSEVITTPTKLDWGLYKPTFVFSSNGTNIYPVIVTNNTETAQDINISLDTFILIV